MAAHRRKAHREALMLMTIGRLVFVPRHARRSRRGARCSAGGSRGLGQSGPAREVRMEASVRPSVPGNQGPLGQPRGIGFGILLYIVTLNFYSWYWVYKTAEEMKRHTGDGLGGVLGLVIWILLNPVMAFV